MTSNLYSTMAVNTGGNASWRAVQGGVLEAYTVGACNQLPNATKIDFEKIVVKDTAGPVTPTFSGERRVTSCSTSMAASGSGGYTQIGWSPK